MDHDYYSLERFGIFGIIGALSKFALRVCGHGFIGKSVQRAAHRTQLRAYRVLIFLVPVNLGVTGLVDEY